MLINLSPLYYSIQNSINNSKPESKFDYTATLHTRDKDIPLDKVISIDIERDYVNKVGDDVRIEFIMPLGDYAYLLYPYRSNIEITIKRVLLDETGNKSNDKQVIETERFKAIFLDKNLNVKGDEYNNYNQESLNLVKMVTVDLQLINRHLEVLRIKTLCGPNIFKNITPEDAIVSMLGGEANKIQIDGVNAIDVLDIVKPDNREIKKNLVIPHGTKVLSIPTLLQEKLGGVYNGGIGTYIQGYKNKNSLFVYPLFKTNKISDNDSKLIFYSVPKSRYKSLERSYYTDGMVTHILSTGNKVYKDDSENNYTNSGVGFKMVDARAITKKPVELTEDGPVANRTRLNTEVAIKNKDDNLNFMPFADTPISSNQFTQYSNVMMRSGGSMELVWENSDYRLIRPGMSCKVIYMEDTVQFELNGIVLFAHTFVKMNGKGMYAFGHNTNTNLVLFLEKLPIQDTPNVTIETSVDNSNFKNVTTTVKTTITNKRKVIETTVDTTIPMMGYKNKTTDTQIINL